MDTKINISDLKTAFQFKTDKELRYSCFVFNLLQYPKMVKLLTLFANSIIRYNLPLQFLFRKTVFRVFCAGENIEEAFQLIKRLDGSKVQSVLDYVSESEKRDEAFQRNSNIIVSNIIKLGKEAPGNYVSVKLSGLEEPEFFKAINLEIGNENRSRYELFLKRLDLICKTGCDYKVIIYIDAEDRFMQDIFDKVTEQMMLRYNKTEAIVFNTLQMYLKDRLAYLDYLITDAKAKKYIPGIKLVRGAYIDKERETALKENKESPVYANKKQTDSAFNKAIEMCLKEHLNVCTCIASHNNESTLFAIECINRYNIVDHKTKVRFSQLYGMSDHLTFNLAVNGYSTSKYLPYGEIKKAIPYLIRRSEENSSINGQIPGEVIRLRDEIRRRNQV